ncbi:MAG: hypothetical protein M9887_10940 [Chitinophagales bacterium]|nr:hypothetical protein [Chitinophagales bacterium]
MKRFKIKINKNEEQLIKFLNDNELDIFTFSELLDKKDLNIDYLQMTLANLVRRRLLIRLEKGKYCRHNFRDEYVIGSVLASGGIIAYWSALNIHGLTEQISNTVFVQTPKIKKDKTVLGIAYRFIKVKDSKITGIEKWGYGNHSYFITNREKTIIDCFDLPQYAGEFPGIVRAFVNNGWEEKKLIEYAEVVGNKAAIKRMGYLCELFELPYLQFIDFAKSKVTRTIALFDNNSPDIGQYITQWGLRLNIEEEDLLNMKSY